MHRWSISESNNSISKWPLSSSNYKCRHKIWVRHKGIQKQILSINLKTSNNMKVFKPLININIINDFLWKPHTILIHYLKTIPHKELLNFKMNHLHKMIYPKHPPSYNNYLNNCRTCRYQIKCLKIMWPT